MRSGASAIQCTIAFMLGNAYGGSMFWWMRPVDRPCGWAILAASGASSGTLGRFAVATGSQARVSHAATSPPASTAARSSRSWAGPWDPSRARLPASTARAPAGPAPGRAARPRRRRPRRRPARRSRRRRGRSPARARARPRMRANAGLVLVRALGGGPDGGAVRPHVGHAAGGTDGAVRLHGPAVGGGERPHARAAARSARPDRPFATTCSRTTGLARMASKSVA